MSEPWIWEPIDDQLDTGSYTDDAGAEVMQYRHHIALSAHRLLTATEAAAWTTRIGEVATTFTAKIGSVDLTKSISTGKFICVKHKLVPDKNPAAFATEQIAFEYYSKWEDVPSTWGWDTTP